MMQAGGLISFRIEDIGNLGISEESTIELTDTLLESFGIGRLFVAAHPPFVTELLMRPRLPIDLNPDLPMNSLAIDDHIANHQTQHLLAISICCCVRLPKGREVTAQSDDGRSIRFSERSEGAVEPCLVLFLSGFHCA